MYGLAFFKENNFQILISVSSFNTGSCYDLGQTPSCLSFLICKTGIDIHTYLTALLGSYCWHSALICYTNAKMCYGSEWIMRAL